MKKILNILLVVLLITVVVPLHLRANTENDDAEKEVDNKDYSLANPYLSDPSFRFQLSKNISGNDSALRFYVKDMKFNVLLISDTFKLPPIKVKISEPKKRWGRTTLEVLGHFVYATASYWIREDVMKEDWEYQFTWEDQKRRFLFLDGPRFDSNTFQFNWTHSLAGAMYYNYARINRLNMLESFLVSTAASTFWEFVVEFKEVVSINDMITTTLGGPSIGEALFHVSRVFRDSRPTVLNQIGCFLSKPLMTLNNWMDRKKNGPKIQDGAASLWHDFRLFIGPRSYSFSTDHSGITAQVGVETQIMHMPEYGEPGMYSGSMGTTFTEFNLDAGVDQKGLYEFNIFAKSVLFGYYNQDIRETGDEKTGYSFFLGAGTAFDLMRRRTPKTEDDPDEAFNTDKLCVINLLGPAFDLSLFHKDLKIRLTADIYADFALVHSTAYQQYAALNEVTNTKSTLLEHGYYYAIGFTTSSLLQVDFANIELKGKVKYHYFDSVEGLDRFQKDMADEDDFELRDKRLNYHVSLGYTIPNSAVQLVVALEKTDRRGWLEDFYREHSETRSYFQVKYLF
jgi:hypothetical protein